MSQLKQEVRLSNDNESRTGIHHKLIESAMPAWIVRAPLHRVGALKKVVAPLPEWIKTASSLQHLSLQRTARESWLAQNEVDRLFGTAQDVYAFAAPLLRQALKEQYAVDVNVKETFLKLYAPATSSPWVYNIDGAVKSRTVSLLDAALHNFAASEVLLPDSQFISRPDPSGRFDILDIRDKISIDQFRMLCRTLDLGARYKAHLESYVLPQEALARAVVKHSVITNQKAALSAALSLAIAQGHVSAGGYLAVQSMLKDIQGWSADGVPVRYYQLKMLGVSLRGIVLIAPDLDAGHSGTRRVVAYVPHDPQHPLKEYASLADFAQELTRQLREHRPRSASQMSYQQFFSRFVDHQQRGHFFAALNAALTEVTWHEKVPGIDQPSWRETPVAAPRLRFEYMRIEEDVDTRFTGDLWLYLYQQQQNKVLNDGVEIAISTAYADRMARWAWFDNLEKMLADIINVALLVVAPFIPGVGEAMMVYMAYQMVSEVVEGVLDLAEGLYLDGAEHLIGFAEGLIQLGTFGLGGAIAGEVVMPKLSSFIESTRPVTLASGETRLWSQDLKPYQQKNLVLAADSQPDEFWLHRHQGKPILRLDDAHFEVQKDPLTGKHRVRHPTRPGAYQPWVESNGGGAFVIEGEQPRYWDETTLLNRLDPNMRALADAYGNIRTISRTDANAIRQMYVGNERPLPLLSDTVTRLRIDRDIQTFIEQMGSPQPQAYLRADPELQFELLNGLWPGQAVELVDGNGEVLRTIGLKDGPAIRIERDRLVNVDLAERLLAHLDDGQIRELLNDEFGTGRGTPATDAKSLRIELARLGRAQRVSLFESRYRRLDRATGAEGQTLQDNIPGLPGAVVRELVAKATVDEVRAIQRGEVPARLKNLGNWALREVRVSRAYEGFYLDAVDNPDTRRLALHSLENLPGWSPDVRIEVRRFDYDGQVIDSIGKHDASIQRTLVEREDFTFVAYDQDGLHLHSGMDFFSSILQAVPDAQRAALNLNIGQGPELKVNLAERALKPYQLLKMLDDLPKLDPFTYDPQLMRLRGGAPTTLSERAALQQLGSEYDILVNATFHSSVSQFKRYDYLRGIRLMHPMPDEYFGSLADALVTANAAVDHQARLEIIQSIEALPDLQKLMLPEPFDALIGRLFTDQGFVPLTESERNLAINARNLQQTGRSGEYQALVQAVRDDTAEPAMALADLSAHAAEMGHDVTPSGAPVEVAPATLADLQTAQRAVYRTKQLLPLSGNQLPTLWEKGGSAIAKIKGLRALSLEEGGYTAKLSIAEAAQKAIEIKGGNCSENSKVTFAVLASQSRTSSIHIVKATDFDHQYVVIGDDLENLDTLVVADSWPEFPTAHLASKGFFKFELPAVESLPAGPAVAEYDFINQTPPGPAALPVVSEESTFRQIKINKLYQTGAYAQWTSLREVGQTYAVEGGTPVSFERLPASVIENRLAAYNRFLNAFKDFLRPRATVDQQGLSPDAMR